MKSVVNVNGKRGLFKKLASDTSIDMTKVKSPLMAFESKKILSKKIKGKMVPEINQKLSSIRGVLQDLRDKPDLRVEDYLKQDYNSRAKFKENTALASQLAKVRYINNDVNSPVSRSFCGSIKDYKKILSKKKSEAMDKSIIVKVRKMPSIRFSVKNTANSPTSRPASPTKLKNSFSLAANASLQKKDYGGCGTPASEPKLNEHRNSLNSSPRSATNRKNPSLPTMLWI